MQSEKTSNLYGGLGSAREHRHMELSSIAFLLWQKKCILFMKERGGILGNPDILAVGENRLTYEIEIKCSVQDFKRNKDKDMQRHLALYPEKGRNYFWYMVSPDIAEKCLPHVEPEFGLITLDGVYHNGIKVLKRAKKIHSKRVSPKKMIEFVRHQAGTTFGLIDKLHRAQSENESLRENTV